jgi:hypothetical protein
MESMQSTALGIFSGADAMEGPEGVTAMLRLSALELTARISILVIVTGSLIIVIQRACAQ